MNYLHLEFLVGIMVLASLLLVMPAGLYSGLLGVLAIIAVVNFGDSDCDYSSWELVLKVVILTLSLPIMVLMKRKEFSEVGVLVMSVVLSSLFLVSSHNLLAVYIALELQSLSLFIFISRKKNSPSKVEAGLKYFVLSSISSGILLLGAALHFCFTGSCDIASLSDGCLSFEKVMVIAALLFKLAVAPFHIWSPDVYQGADNQSLVLLGTLPKISVIAVLVSISPSLKLLLIAAVLSLITGCVGALNQINVRKLLAYSGIMNMGFVLLGLGANSHYGLEASIFYVFVYMLSFVFLVSISDMAVSKDASLPEFSGIISGNAVLLVSVVLIAFSFAGIPPFAGFLIKWFVLSSTMAAKLIFGSILSVTCAIIAGVYYLRIVKIGYFQVDKAFYAWKSLTLKRGEVSFGASIVLGSIFFFTAFLIFCPQVFMQAMHFAALAVF